MQIELLFAFIVALAAGWLVARTRHVKIVDRLSTMALIGLVVARGAFVIEYLPQYLENPVSIIDIRDGGFTAIAGLAAAALYGAWLAWRRSSVRVPLVSAVVAGALAWGLTGGTAMLMKPQVRTVPNAKLLTLSGESVRLDALVAKHDGRPILINLWASWCPPCRAEMPILAEAQRKHPGVLFLFVNQGESFATVASFLHSQGLALNHVLRDPRRKLARRVLPTTLLYDAEGKLLDLHRGMYSRATLAHALEQFDTASVTPEVTALSPKESR